MMLVTVVLKPIQDIQHTDVEMALNDALVWGNLRAMDLGEEFRHYQFVEDPHICSVLSLASMELEGSAVEEMHKEIETLIKTIIVIKDQRKAFKQKNPNLKW